jgi:hypothetical protein
MSNLEWLNKKRIQIIKGDNLEVLKDMLTRQCIHIEAHSDDI